MRVVPCIVVLSAMSSIASGSTFLGNPSSKVVLIDAGEVYVDELEASRCGSTTDDTFNLGATLEQHDDVGVSLVADVDYCDLVVYVRWQPSSAIVAVPVDGFTQLSVLASGDPVQIELEASSETAVLVQP